MSLGLYRVAIAVLTAIFSLSGALKVVDPLAFAAVIDGFPGMGRTASVALAYYLPWLELISGCALLLAPWRRGGLLLLATLTVLFSGALVLNLLVGSSSDCGCFGAADSGTSPLVSLFRNIALLGLTILLLRRDLPR